MVDAVHDWYDRNPDALKNSGAGSPSIMDAQSSDPISGPILAAHKSFEDKKKAATQQAREDMDRLHKSLYESDNAAAKAVEEARAKRVAMKPPLQTTHGPYVDNTSKWAELAAKHSIYQAAQDGSDYFAWPKGEDVADRYKMRHVLDHLSYSKKGDGNWELSGKTKNGENFDKPVPDDKLHDFVGAEMADRIRKGDIGSPPEVLPHDPNAVSLFDIHKQKEAHANAIAKFSAIKNERIPLTENDEAIKDNFKRRAEAEKGIDAEARKLRDLHEVHDEYMKPGAGKIRELHPDLANITQEDVWKVERALKSDEIHSAKYHELDKTRKLLQNALHEKNDYESAINSRTITGQDLDLGGHGHRKFYNEIYPQRVQEVFRKGGYGKPDIGTVHLKTNALKSNPFLGPAYENDTREYHGIRLTPELREKILQGGFPQYAAGGIVKKTMDNDVVTRALRLVRDEDEFHDAKRIAGDTNDQRAPFASGGSLQGNPGIPSGQEGELPLGGGIRGGAGLREAPPAGYVSSPGLEGLPTQVKIPMTGQTIAAGPDHRIRAVAHDYMRKAGLRYNPAKTYQKVDPERAKRIAAAYEKMEHAPQNPLVRSAYAKMAEETKAQYQAAKEAGAKFEFWDPQHEKDPYEASPRLATEDLKHNHHMFVYPTEAGFGSDEDAKAQLDENPLLADSGERWNGKKVTVNDMFRAIHDYYGHAKEGVGFRADGEENAWRSHASMFSPLARLAMTSETRGQNSWLNYGPHGDKNKKARTDETVFADQKTGILPPWVMFEGADDFLHPDDIKSANEAYRKHKDRGGSLSKPAIVGIADPARKVLQEKAAQMELERGKRTKPTGEKVFEDTPEAYERTTSIVPQESFSHKYPQPIAGKPLPGNQRLKPIIKHADAIAAKYAESMAPFKDKNVHHFYHTGPVYEGIAPGLGGMDKAKEAMHTFGASYAGTSPRTATEQNLGNASLIAYKHAHGIPFDKTVEDTGTANDKGYPMMDMHKNLSKALLEGKDVFNSNPKPSSFMRNVMGNHEGVTVDTHNIRGILKSLDDLHPGHIPKEWFNSADNYKIYKKHGLTPGLLAGGIEDGLKDQTEKGINRQSEYGPMADITERSAKLIGVPRAPTQSLGWFGLGEHTNLKSAPSTLVDLLNQRINVTAQHLGVKPDAAKDLWAKHKIPLMNRGGEVENGKAQEGNVGRGLPQNDLGSGGHGNLGILPRGPQAEVTLSHWSHAPREVVDPNFAGSNEQVRGAEKLRRGHDNWHNRTYWGVNGGYSPEGGMGPYRHEAKMDKSDLYDLAGDPLNLKNKIGSGKNTHPVNEIEHLIKSHGFKGYYRHHPELGSVAAVFHPIKPSSVVDEHNTKALSLTRDTDDVRDAMRLVGGNR